MPSPARAATSAYVEAQAATNQIARALLSGGAKTGTRFAGLSPNCTEIELATLGAMRAGGAFCNVNLRAGVEANVDILRRGACEVLFFHSTVADTIPAFTEAIPELRLVLCVDSDETAYPSVSRMVRARVRMLGWITSALERPRVPGVDRRDDRSAEADPGIERVPADVELAWATCWQFDIPPVNLAVAPVTHAGGMIVFAHFQFGGTTVFMDTPDIDQVLELIETRRVTTLFLPPTLIYMLLAHPRLAETDTSSLRYLISAAAPIAPEKLIEGVQKLGPVMCQAYGQTEAGFPLTWMSPAEVAEREHR